MMTEAAPTAPAPQAPQAPEAPEGGKPPDGATAAEKKIWKLKAGGEEFDFDASDEEAVKREIMKARGANKKFEEAAKMRREAEEIKSRQDELIERAKKDPRTLRELQKHGVNLREFAEQLIWEDMQFQKMSPEQRELMELRQRRQEWEQEKQGQKDAEEKRQMAELQTQFEAQYEKTIIEALETNKIPKSRATVERMAKYLQIAVAKGIEVDAKDLVTLVRRDMKTDYFDFVKASDDESLGEFMDEDLTKRIRERDLKRLKTTQGEVFKTPDPQTAKTRDTPKPKKMSGADWRNELLKESRRRGG